MQTTIHLPNEAATLALGARLADALRPGDLLFLLGDLGAGKTTLARGLLHALGYQQAIKSPSYTIVEPYQQPGKLVYHFDLYRLSDPEELMDIGLTDYLSEDALIMVEWPQKAQILLPQPTLECHLRNVSDGREATLTAHGERAAQLLKACATL